MKRALLIVLCLSMITSVVPFAKSVSVKQTAIQSVTVISPGNVTYNTATPPFNLPLKFDIGISKLAMITWMGYSLDDAANVTITGDTVIPVGYGYHDVVVYATDIEGITLASEKVYFTVSIIGDLNGDGEVDLIDVSLFLQAYGSTSDDPNWNPQADMAYPHGKIDIFDLVTIITHYGETMP